MPRELHTYFPGGKAVKPHKLKFDAQKIMDCLRVPMNEEVFVNDNQLAITHAEREDSFKSGIGSLYNYQTGKFDRKTSDYTILNKAFVGTYIEQVVDEVKELAAKYWVKVGRVRALKLKPATCYVLHSDIEEFRFHIPLITDRGNFFVTNEGVEFMQEPGRVYLFATQEEHTAVNAGKRNRIHLVFDTYK
jgi:hypothetical protein